MIERQKMETSSPHSSELFSSDGTDTQSSPNNIVDFNDSKDISNPINWPFSKKVVTSLLYSLTSLGSVWASTAYVSPKAIHYVLLSKKQAMRQPIPRYPSDSKSTRN